MTGTSTMRPSKGDAYTMPKDGWVCFFCGERFRTPGEAEDHFGTETMRQPGCVEKVQFGLERGLLMARRRYDAALKVLIEHPSNQYQNELAEEIAAAIGVAAQELEAIDVLLDERTAFERDAARYRYLRGRDLDTIGKGGVFAGLTPKNVILNEEDLDRAVDEAMAADGEHGRWADDGGKP